MTEEEAKKLPKAKPHPIVASLPAYLKDPANFDKIQRAILDAGATRHSHGEVVDWAGCVECQSRQRNRLEMMKRLGFNNAAQYMAWRKIHEHIQKKVILPKYNS